jgi:hypothetical protein
MRIFRSMSHRQDENSMNPLNTIAKAPDAPLAWSVYGAIVVWIAGLTAGWAILERYQYTADDLQTAGFVDHWPPNSRLPRSSGHSTLVLFLHPKCPCSRATMSELEHLFTSIQGRTAGTTDCVVDATLPVNFGDEWLNTDTMERARHLTDARVVPDPGGVEAGIFGATTSGLVMLFDRGGRRQYAGGITESRGHEGDNAGLDRLQRILCNEIISAEGIPVFGCRLCLPERERVTGAKGGLGAI